MSDAKKDRISFGPQSWLFPMPVLVVGTYDGNGNPDAMTAAWGGIHDTNQIGMCLSAGHRTVKNLLAAKETGDAYFTVSPAVSGTSAAADLVGMISASEAPDKCARAGLHPLHAPTVPAPLFAEFPLALECRRVSYDPSTGSLVGDILNVTADKSVLGPDGKPDIRLLKPLLFDPAGDAYYGIGGKEDDAFAHTL